jgi:transcriptional regulator with XRE-family HTH domain
MPALNTALFASMIKSKRGERGLRETARELKISPTTLSRLESENLPDVDTYIKICDWLGVSTDHFTSEPSTKNKSVKKQIIAHLRADKTLPKKNAEALIKMIELAYNKLNKKL